VVEENSILRDSQETHNKKREADVATTGSDFAPETALSRAGSRNTGSEVRFVVCKAEMKPGCTISCYITQMRAQAQF
jgi:hypothetical protein